MAKKKKPPAHDWWKDAEPIYKDKGDGQCMLWLYAREVPPADDGYHGNQWEYLLVEVPDGDGPEYGEPVLAICDGGVTQLASGQLIQGE